MKLSGNTILITGGATGIGWALAERFLQAGSEVIVCGRRQEKLQEAQTRYPQLHVRVCDVADETARRALVQEVTREFPKLNVLVNNAGIQQRFSLLDGEVDWARVHQELAINLEAPIQLATLFLPHLQTQADPVIANVTSGLAFVPMAAAPVYCATKAALHSFTMSLRHQLASTPLQVVEIIPPAVNTDLGGVGLHTWGAPLDEFADSVIRDLAAGELEIGFGTSNRNRQASREELNQVFQQMNR